MKQIIITMLMIFLAVPAMLAKSDKYPQATFPKKSHDFGYIKEADGVVTCEFEFINTGNEPLVILSAKPTCAGYFGGFLKTINVRTNGREKRTTLTLEGSVIPKE